MGPVEQFGELLRSNDFVFLVYFRGHWCPFCMSYLHKLQQISELVEAKSGKVVAVTAEPESELCQTRKESGYHGTVIVDTSNSLAAELRRLDLLDVARTSKSGYKNGMAQPAILVLKSHNMDDVMFRWAIMPSFMDFGGAKDRPELDQVWDNVQSQLQGLPVVHKSLKHTSALGLLREKIVG